jgi:HK97 family phage portal protein
MPSPKANKRSPRRSTARPRKTDERMISVLGTLLEPSPWGRLSASDVTPEVAVRVSSIFAVCRFIAQGVGVMPIQIGRTLASGRKERFSPPCAYTIRSRPNGWQSRFDFMTLQAYWTALHGNGFARILSGDHGWMSQLIPMHPSRVRLEQLSDYSMRYKFLDSSGKWIPLRQEEVLHWRWMSENGIWGMSPSEICATSISLARQLDIAATSFWKNGARPDFLIQTAEKISDPAIAELREQFRQMYSGHNRGSPGVVSSKVQLLPMQSNTMEQSQYLELRSAILPDVCRHWGVPSTLLGDAKMARYSNVEQEHLSAQVWCLLPWQHRIEGPLDMALQPVYGEDVYCKLDNRGLLRGDSASRAALYQSMFNMGSIKPNEIRDLEDFELLDDPAADETFMQLGFSTLGNAAAAAAAAPDATDPAAADPGRAPGAGVPEAGGFREGQYVYFDGGEGTIEHLMVDGVLGVEGSPFAIPASAADPAASIRVYLNGEPTEFTVGKRVADLSAEPLDQGSQT